MTHLRGVKPVLSQDQESLQKAPSAPKRFNKFAKAEWQRVLPDLVARKIITRADLAGVENYCVAIGEANKIAEVLAEMLVPDLKLGGLQIRYMQTARQLAAEYGLTPTSRSRVGNGGASDDDLDNPLNIGKDR